MGVKLYYNQPSQILNITLNIFMDIERGTKSQTLLY